MLFCSRSQGEGGRRDGRGGKDGRGEGLTEMGLKLEPVPGLPGGESYTQGESQFNFLDS